MLMLTYVREETWIPTYDPSVLLVVKGLTERFAADPLFQKEFIARMRTMEALDYYDIDHLPRRYSDALPELLERYVAAGPQVFEGVTSPAFHERCYRDLVLFQRVLQQPPSIVPAPEES